MDKAKLRFKKNGGEVEESGFVKATMKPQEGVALIMAFSRKQRL